MTHQVKDLQERQNFHLHQKDLEKENFRIRNYNLSLKTRLTHDSINFINYLTCFIINLPRKCYKKHEVIKVNPIEVN